MYSTRSISLYLIIFGWNLLSNSISNSSACEECNQKTLNFRVVMDEMFLLNYTGKSMTVYAPSATNATAFGSILGDELYKFYGISYYWRTCPLTDIFFVHIRLMYFNTKYGSFTNALNYPNGILRVTFPVCANALVDNPKFEAFEKAFGKIKHPGKFMHIQSPFTYTWFQNFPPSTIYKYYESEYVDESTGRTYPCVKTLEGPLMPLSNFISRRQFQETFGSLKDSWWNPINNPPTFNYPTSQIGVGAGVVIKPIYA